MMTAEQSLSALQTALAAEHAAVYAYGVCGGVLDGSSSAGVRARDGYLAHQQRRERLQRELRALGAEPAAALPGYDLPGPVTNIGSAARLARLVEDRCSVGYADLVRQSTPPVRRLAVDWLSEAATRGLDWSAEPTAFPGFQDR